MLQKANAQIIPDHNNERTTKITSYLLQK